MIIKLIILLIISVLIPFSLVGLFYISNKIEEFLDKKILLRKILEFKVTSDIFQRLKILDGIIINEKWNVKRLKSLPLNNLIHIYHICVSSYNNAMK